ncbi:MAG: putative signal transducing protein [Chloroflexota bacterium]
MVKLAFVDSEPLAEMFADMLRNEGITCVVKGAGAYSSALPFEINDHYLFVPAADLERAGQLLGEYSDANGALSLGAPAALAARYGRRRREQTSRGSRWR